MVATARTQKRYDHRLRELVRTTQGMSLTLQYGVPRSTARRWLTASTRGVRCSLTLSWRAAVPAPQSAALGSVALDGRAFRDLPAALRRAVCAQVWLLRERKAAMWEPTYCNSARTDSATAFGGF